MPSSKLRLKFFKENHSDTSIDAFTHWMQSEYDQIESKLKEAREERDSLKMDCEILYKRFLKPHGLKITKAEIKVLDRWKGK